ncbi:hypothetical protein [Caldimonas brevitalea]|uniref:Uncharacterized protein n=1 Tax=Caldimonas brevitalea TaxID=413882 RepID=A0A0G3BV16_9BURK|nr:hypothetical protein [Caldimonas brevitalea]AKJ31838.1 hypothetical protein AAW51_5147 [Caldimonas brevitalea]
MVTPWDAIRQVVEMDYRNTRSPETVVETGVGEVGGTGAAVEPARPSPYTVVVRLATRGVSFKTMVVLARHHDEAVAAVFQDDSVHDVCAVFRGRCLDLWNE